MGVAHTVREAAGRQAVKLSRYPRWYASKAHSYWYPVIGIGGGVSPDYYGSSRPKVLFVTVPKGYGCAGGSVQSPAGDPRWLGYRPIGHCAGKGIFVALQVT